MVKCLATRHYRGQKKETSPIFEIPHPLTTFLYCTQEMKTTMYVIYKDSFVKQDGQWLIQHRTSNFVRTEAEEVK